MTSALAASSGWPLGSQRPRILHLPRGEDHPDADAVIEFAAACGIILDDWQQFVLRCSLRRHMDVWAALEVALCAPRQNGKNGILEIRELAGPLLFGEKLVVHTAHLTETADEAFLRLVQIIEENAWLSAQVRHVWRTNGKQAIEFTNRGRIKFRTRTRGGGRGFSGDLVVFDEAMYFAEVSHGAIFPIASAAPNPQFWYTGSAVDQQVHEEGVVFSRIRHRALADSTDRLAYFEWSFDAESPDDVTYEEASDPEILALANPALGIRISHDYLQDELRALDPRTHAVERLCVGDWPPVSPDEGGIFDMDRFRALADDGSTIVGKLVFVFDVNPDRTWASVAAAGFRPDGMLHLEIAKRERGTGWVKPWLVQRTALHQPEAVLCAENSPAAALIRGLEDADVKVTPVSSADHAKACGEFFDLVEQAGFRYPSAPPLIAAVKGARTKTLGDAWAWSRKNSAVDISPLVAVTLAAQAAAELCQDDGELNIW